MKHVTRKQRSGFTLIELLIVIAVIAILAAIAIPNLLSSRQSANEASAIGSLRTINSAEATYRSKNGSYADVATLQAANLVDPALAASDVTSPTGTAKSGYFYSRVIAPTATQYAFIEGPGTNAGTRYFYTDETGVIFQAPGSVTLPTTDASGSQASLGSGWSQIGN